MSTKPQTIDDYLAPLSSEKRAALEKLRRDIKSAAPKAEECISYDIPGFPLGGKLLVSFGAGANHCVSTTARMAGNLGFTVTIVEDATATFERRGPDGTHYSADLMHRAALASLHEEFATVRSAEGILADAGA